MIAGAATDKYPLKLDRLPPGWCAALLRDCCAGMAPGFASGSHNKQGAGIPHLRPMNINRRGDLDLTDIKCIEPRADARRVHVGDVLFNNTNSPVLVGKTCAIRIDRDMAFSNHMTRLRPSPGMRADFLARQLHFLWASGYFLHRCVKHVNQASISTGPLADTVPMLVAPSKEQRRIAESLDSFFTRLDDAEATLERVKRNLERYRASVLQAAVEGRLVPTEANLARMEGREYETGAALIARTCSGIVSRWLAKPTTARADYRPGEGLPELPEGWRWSTWAHLARRVTVGYVGPMKEEYRNEGVAFLRSQNVRPNRFDPEGLKRISPAFHLRLSKSALTPGDILIVRSGTVGTACIVPDFLTVANCSDMVVVQGPKAIRPRFGAYYMNSMATLRLVQSKKVGIALSHFNTHSVASLPVPVPPLAEQDRIVEKTEMLLSVIDDIEQIVTHTHERHAQLRQTVLCSAFEGRLVDQDSTDEPAAVLLDRLRAERVQAVSSPELPRRAGRPPKAVKM